MSVSGRACHEEIDRRCVHLPSDLLHDPRYAMNSVLWDTWLRDEDGLRWKSFFAGSPPSPRWRRVASPPQMRGRRHVRGFTSTPSPSPSPPPPPPMTEEEEAELMRRVMEDSMNTHDERQWVGLKMMLSFSTAGNMAISELEQAVVVK
ncbi:hypothetical protein D1007_25037 [Hordeum vulgare]|nr:hypothetical protein D1007_25037 [Hordeum vulgare]